MAMHIDILLLFEKNVNCVLQATIRLQLCMHPGSWYQFPLQKNHHAARKIHDLEQVCVCVCACACVCVSPTKP